MSGIDLRINMIERAAGYESRPLKEYEQTLLNFIATYIEDDVHQKLLCNILMDCAFRIFFGAAIKKFPDEKSLSSENIKLFLKEKTFLPDYDVNRIQQLLKGALSFKYGPRPKNDTKKRIREKSSGNCYLCGLPVNADDEDEIDHVWPHSVGGNNSKENLKLAHAQCAAIKADAATLADLLMIGWTYPNPPTGLQVPAHQLEFWPSKITDKGEFNRYRRHIVASNLRLAIFMKQDYRCVSCNSPFADVGAAQLLPAENTLEWSVLTVSAFCEDCCPIPQS